MNKHHGDHLFLTEEEQDMLKEVLDEGVITTLVEDYGHDETKALMKKLGLSMPEGTEPEEDHDE